MAPEIFKHKNVCAGPPLDIWAMGCIQYAMLFGNQPFIAKTENALKQKIMDEPVHFSPDIIVTNECKDIIRKMLLKDPEHRIGMLGIKEHPWYKIESIS